MLRMPEGIVAEINEKGIPQAAFESLDPVIAETDVLYVTRVQKERFEDPSKHEELKGSYVVTTETMDRPRKR
nr:hypothetical protein [uncultured Hyphomonas sp.]